MSNEPLISTRELAERLGDENVLLLDCRFDLFDTAAGARSWREGRIPGAIHADLDDVLAGPVTDTSGRHPLPDPEMLAQWLGQHGADNDTAFVVYDGGSGAVAARAWWLLYWLGHDKASMLDGGFAAWTGEGRPVEDGTATESKPRSFVPAVRENAVVTTDEIARSLPGLLLVDAREAARFHGEREPIDSVAGHIPGSRNLPYTRNLTESGHWRAADAILSTYRSVLGAPPGEDWVAMCGSGVTACHLAIGGLLAGYRMPRLYIGSWSEWIRNPERPVEKE